VSEKRKATTAKSRAKAEIEDSSGSEATAVHESDASSDNSDDESEVEQDVKPIGG
jgi:hypothetical protein